jgi:hypothetical protein
MRIDGAACVAGVHKGEHPALPCLRWFQSRRRPALPQLLPGSSECSELLRPSFQSECLKKPLAFLLVR